MNDRFGKFNPVVSLIFYAGAVTMGVVFVHPLFQVVSLTMASAHCILVKRDRVLRDLRGMVPLFVLITVINPLVNDRGATVLFTCWGRAFTMEALVYGAVIGLMFMTVIMWFSSYNSVMSGEKLICVFGNAAPAVSMMTVMVLRLVPSFREQAFRIGNARRSMGRYGDGRLSSRCEVLSSLVSWALEGGVISADSMRCRGYGSCRRTHFSIYRFTGRDVLVTVLMAVLAAVIIWCGVSGGMEAVFLPSLEISSEGLPFAAGIVSYGLFLSLPVTVDLLEEIKWHYLRSRI